MGLETLLEKIKSSHGDAFDYGLVERAYRFAEEAHSLEAGKSGDDAMTRPAAVAMRLAEWRLDPAAIAASLLHDVAADTPITRRDIEKRFGSEVAFLVGALAKLKTVHYTPLEARADGAAAPTKRRGLPLTGQAENLRKMVLALAEDIRVVIIKLFDRLHALETVSSLAPDDQRRMAKETIELYAPLANRLGMGEIKGQLEDLAFPVVYPEEYQWLHKQVKEPLEERRRFAERLIPEIRELLVRENVSPSDVHARAKHWYSLWRKLERYDKNLESIYDLVALRIIVPAVEQCYAALGAIHARFPPLPGRIKDYIALPKVNGYRSLHTTIFGPEGKITEIQIRTPEMHREAEGGIAAHWAYSEEGEKQARSSGASTLQRSRDLTWINQLREWHAHFQDAGEFVESLKIDFFKDRIFVFTPKGEVIDLPEGATPVDFAYHIHSAIGDQAAGAKVNGKMASLSSALKNSDIVEILTQKNKKPSRQWLEFVKTSIARKHIQSALKKPVGARYT
ncbi:MAG: bifunctional (p)ppGpp synthetase/guanosine-3',5'-bis(diphosphate) 3'-pyrophosphohydrolase [Candidatus Sungbacteria bacterium]|uniref:Bifunctional (P)ppGpp synthetase/guanosine-3',5'-bis(Diphosphate) 3'-pyrophosphohydrolase n=1 Tax=Candidatus Sungiibacteriota bacterium TaxID=2750080 RepID=A0A933DU84_9BACT|nr:bifunctional (p)ppGpp synthetase/guanosine-3',5'-bis(diphosphate) 3'-pyrophosphohydrolase [Candidatus Sungbacteria bacterium]